MSNPSTIVETWSSHLAFYLSVVGAAVGLDRAGLAERFAALLADPLRLTMWHAAFMGATVLVGTVL